MGLQRESKLWLVKVCEFFWPASSFYNSSLHSNLLVWTNVERSNYFCTLKYCEQLTLAVLAILRLFAASVLGRKHFVCHRCKRNLLGFVQVLLIRAVIPKTRVLLRSLLGIAVAHAALLQGGGFVFKSTFRTKGGNRRLKGSDQDIP